MTKGLNGVKAHFKVHGGMPGGFFLKTIAAFMDISRLEDDSFDGDGEHSDVYVRLTSCAKELHLKFV